MVISPRLPEGPPPAQQKERAKLNPNPQAALKERARALARITPAARAAIRTKQASSGEQGSEDEPGDSQEDEVEEEANGDQEEEPEEKEDEPEEKEEEPEELGEERSSEEMRSSGNQGEGTPEVSTPKSEDGYIDPDHNGDQAGMTDAGEVTGGQGAMTDGGGSVGPKRRGNRGGKKHRKKQNTGSTSDAGWYRVPGGTSGASGSEGSRGSWKSWKSATKGYGGYVAASQKARNWR